jgi:hypothetical protein
MITGTCMHSVDSSAFLLKCIVKVKINDTDNAIEYHEYCKNCYRKAERNNLLIAEEDVEEFLNPSPW